MKTGLGYLTIALLKDIYGVSNFTLRYLEYAFLVICENCYFREDTKKFTGDIRHVPFRILLARGSSLVAQW